MNRYIVLSLIAGLSVWCVINVQAICNEMTIAIDDREAKMQVGKMVQASDPQKQEGQKISRTEKDIVEEIVREVVYREGFLFYASWDLRAFPLRGEKPFNVSPQFAQRLRNGNTLVCECWDVIELTRDLDIVWQFGEWAVNGSDDQHLNQALSAWFYEDTGTVLIADTGNNRILEVEKETKKILRKVTGVKRPSSAFLDPGSGNLIISQAQEHCVCEMDWNGKIVWQFGVSGESGTDAQHLRDPWTAHPAKTSWGVSFDGVLIADYGNNRVLLVRKEDKKIVKETLSTGPELALQTHNLGVAVTGQIIGFVLDQDWDARWYLPHNWRIVPTPESTFLLLDRVNLCEVDPRVFAVNPTYRVPGSYRMLTSFQLPANKSVGPIESTADFKDAPPIPVFAFRDGFTLWVKSSEAASVRILTAKTKWSYAPSLIFDGWEESEEEASLSPNRVWKYNTREHHVFVSIQVTMGGKPGVVDAWIAW